MGSTNMNSLVTVLSGVGPARAAAYAKAGVETLGDLIYHIPRAYENRGDVRPLREARRDGGKTAVMIFDGKKVNTPADGGRKISDIVYIGEVAE